MQLEIPLARNSDPETSHVAAEKSAAFRATHDAKIYAALDGTDTAGGLTYREIAFYAALEPVAVARRLVSMERRKLIRRERDMLSGRYLVRDGCALWRKA